MLKETKIKSVPVMLHGFRQLRLNYKLLQGTSTICFALTAKRRNFSSQSLSNFTDF